VDKDTENTLGELEFYLKTHNNLPIEKERRNRLTDCQHFHVVLDDEKHTVTCRNCKKELDPYWYLSLLASEWNIRRYTDAEAIQAYRALKQQRLNAEAKGKVVIKPTEGEGLIVWETYEACFGKEPKHIYKRRGHGWRAVDEHECDMDFDYIKMQLAYKQRGLLK
jgi:hypothetical protein